MKRNAILMVALLAVLSVQIPMAHGQLMNSSITALATTSTNSTQINGIVDRAFGIVAGVAGLVIAILWVPIAIGYFSRDLDRKADAKERTKDALIGTIIFVMAISGVLYAVIHYIVVG
ncbi:MAG: hypothetical protein ACP5LC_01830 [Thermoplasmata archaeon]